MTDASAIPSNDLLVNGLGIFSNAAGAKIAYWIDPAGALLISCMSRLCSWNASTPLSDACVSVAVLLIGVWGSTLHRLFTYLLGKAAPLEFNQLVSSGNQKQRFSLHASGTPGGQPDLT